nr:hypothetical protein [Candidatus Enterousia merdequi]
MKKIALTSLLAVFAVSGAHAATDYFVGGSFAFLTNEEHTSTFGVVPEFGWKYNDKWDFGVKAGFAREHEEDENIYTYGAGVFARYNVVQFGDFKVLVRGDADIEFSTYDKDDFDAETFTSIGFSVAPMVTYDISESFTLYAKLNFLSVDARYNFKHDSDYMSRDKNWNVEVLGDSDNVANTEDFQIGFTYNF